MSDSTKAIFLSYASQDAEVARRICDALRAVGLDVWFDQSALRGGDAWDASIRRQIKECALFVPIISANTQAREEGYFRREWNLAVNRTLDMADDKAFLLPVVIDATVDVSARVPEKFRDVQWTHLPAGEASAAFAERVQRLLSGAAARMPPDETARSHACRGGAGAAARSDESPSIAVLPFVNMSRDEENEYFADGLSEELLNVLAKIRGLRVASRTSAFSFKGKDVDIPTVAQKLNVATVLEGSVRKSGKRVRITAQLIEVASDSHLWSETYDRELDDIFAVQDDIAQSVVKELRAALLGDGRRECRQQGGGGRCAQGGHRAQRQSRGLPALPAGKVLRRADHAGGHRQGDRAVPAGAGARSGLRAGVGGPVADPPDAGGIRLCADRRGLRASPRRRAARAAPRAGSGRRPHRARPRCNRTTTGTGRRPTRRSGARWSLRPATPMRCAPRPAWRGSWAASTKALELMRKAIALDPLSARTHRQAAMVYMMADRLDDAAAAFQLALDLSPERRPHATRSWRSRACCRGAAEEALAIAQAESHDVFRNLAFAMIHHALGHPAESDAALQALIDEFGWTAAYQVAEAYAYRGEVDKAFEWLETSLRATRPRRRRIQRRTSSCDRCTAIRAGSRSCAG